MNILQRVDGGALLANVDEGGRNPPAPEALLSEFIGFLRRQYVVILAVTLLSLALALVYVINAPARYTATATLIIDTRKNQLFQQQSVVGDIPIDSGAVESQVEILKSETIALSVIRDLRLMDDPEFIGSGGGLVGALTGWVQSAGPRSEFDLVRRAAETFSSQLTVRRVGLTYIMEIGFRSLSPDRAAQIANAVADAYVTDQLEAKYQATRRASAWLQDRIRDLRDQASTAERAVVEFKTKNNIVESGGRLMNEQQLAELNSQLVQARAQRSEARARLDRIQAVISADSPSATVNATVTDTLNNQVVTKLRTQYLELANREADWSSRYGSNHLAAVNLRNQMREIRASILDELRRLAESYKSDFEIAKQREESIQNDLARAVSQSQTTNQAQIALRELESSAQTYRALYDNFLQRYMESVQQQSFPITEARVITAASRPSRKSEPRVTAILALTGLGGLMLGFGLARMRDWSDRVFRTADQVESALQADCVSTIPVIRDAAKRSVRDPPADSDSRIIERDTSLFWYPIDSPFSHFTESLRSLKVVADLQKLSRPVKVIGFTSTMPNEGKSTIATCFAELAAHSGGRVILVDCDLRNPSLTRALTPSATQGIIEVIAGEARLEDVIWTDPSTGLRFLPAPSKSRIPHTSELLGSPQVSALFEELGAAFDYVIVDLSPFAPVVDVRTTTRFIDGYFFIVEWGRTRSDAVVRAFDSAGALRERLLGVVLNKADARVLGRYGYHSYYQNKYYSRYGYGD